MSLLQYWNKPGSLAFWRHIIYNSDVLSQDGAATFSDRNVLVFNEAVVAVTESAFGPRCGSGRILPRALGVPGCWFRGRIMAVSRRVS